jgi:hypothetical protein
LALADKTTIPYVQAYGNITKALQKIQAASTPDRFTQDFLATKLDMKGGSAKPVIPFLKRIGFLASDGSPTTLYKRFRNQSQRGAAAAEALRKGYAPLYEINEYVHDIKDDSALRGVIMQATGLEESSSIVRASIGSFKAVRAFADFDAAAEAEPEEEQLGEVTAEAADEAMAALGRINFGYTINLHLPATSDVAVFNAIFRSLRENLLR